MDARTLFERQDQVTILDVRELNEWRAGRIDGAQHIPLHELPSRIAEVRGSQKVVAVCRSGKRSKQATRFLRASGIDADNLKGGMLAWARLGQPITSADGRPGTVA